MEIRFMEIKDMSRLGLEPDGDIMYEDGRPIFVLSEGYRLVYDNSKKWEGNDGK